jgi:hypothetical protein
MQIDLKQLPDNLKGPDNPDYKGLVPRRARFLHPEVADALLNLEKDTGGLVYTDVYRSPDGSLAACTTKRGCQPPAFSPHNYGLAVDVDLGSVLRKLHTSYASFVDLMAAHGWYCHRRDLDGGAMEAWHFNYLGAKAKDYLKLADPTDHNTWAAPVEKRIQEFYGKYFDYDSTTAQMYLQQLRFYHGDVDGLLGPMSREAIRAFQRAWVYFSHPDQVTGLLDGRTKRVLAVVSSTPNVILLSKPNA